jgi:hypothetical protein
MEFKVCTDLNVPHSRCMVNQTALLMDSEKCLTSLSAFLFVQFLSTHWPAIQTFNTQFCYSFQLYLRHIKHVQFRPLAEGCIWSE